jgi:hypothetical protein
MMRMLISLGCCGTRILAFPGLKFKAIFIPAVGFFVGGTVDPHVSAAVGDALNTVFRAGTVDTESGYCIWTRLETGGEAGGEVVPAAEDGVGESHR